MKLSREFKKMKDIYNFMQMSNKRKQDDFPHNYPLYGGYGKCYYTNRLQTEAYINQSQPRNI